MAASTLSRVLTLFENSSGSLSIRSLARELDVSPGRVEEMIEFWIRKGRIKASSNKTECGTCSVQGDCPLVLEMPRTFELVNENGDHLETVLQSA